MSTELDLKALLKEWQEQDNEHDDLTVVQQGEWEQEHKDQYISTVYRHDPTGRFVEITQNRRGSYWTDWEYGDPDIREVVPEVVTVTRYVAVKGKGKLAAAQPAPAPPQA